MGAAVAEGLGVEGPGVALGSDDAEAEALAAGEVVGCGVGDAATLNWVTDPIVGRSPLPLVAKG